MQICWGTFHVDPLCPNKGLLGCVQVVDMSMDMQMVTQQLSVLMASLADVEKLAHAVQADSKRSCKVPHRAGHYRIVLICCSLLMTLNY